MASLDITMVGALPTDASTPVDVVGFISTHASDPKAARALLDALKTPDAESAYKAAKFQPAD
jgi:hypothetical protein